MNKCVVSWLFKPHYKDRARGVVRFWNEKKTNIFSIYLFQIFSKDSFKETFYFAPRDRSQVQLCLSLKNPIFARSWLHSFIRFFYLIFQKQTDQHKKVSFVLKKNICMYLKAELYSSEILY